MLKQLVDNKPDLKIRLLLWDFSALYALEREPFPKSKLEWDNVEVVLDATLPTGSSQHQKLVIVDDAVAYSGGLDLTIRRWDRREHPFEDPLRCDPSGKPYDPFHDVQALVDGPAAGALAKLAADRWLRATGEQLPISPGGNPWPDQVEADLANIEVAISRTLPAADDAIPPVCEAKALFAEMISAATDEIYIENQYLTAPDIASQLAAQLDKEPGLQALIIAPKEHGPWLEALTMRNGRIRFTETVKRAARDRVRLCYPSVTKGRAEKAVMVHSKVMIVDDRIMRIGSANLNNRSMGTDSECDLTIVAETEQQRAAIRAIRSRLFAIHCGVAEEDAQQAIKDFGLIGASRQLGSDHRLADIDDGEVADDQLANLAEKIGDPERPIDATALLAEMTGNPPAQLGLGAGSVLIGVAVLAALIAYAWNVNDERAEALVQGMVGLHDGSYMSLALMSLAFAVAASAMVPLTLLIAGTAAALGAALDLPVAAFGTLMASLLGYLIGSYGGRGLVFRMLGDRFQRFRQTVARRGLLAVATIRVLPVAPFMLVNMAMGAVQVRLEDFLAGTVLGMAPGFLILGILGDRLFHLVTAPSPASAIIVGALLLAWVAVILTARAWLRPSRLGLS